MAIVPTGRVRLMEKQAVGPDDIKKFEPQGVQNASSPAPRNDIQQEQIGASGEGQPQQPGQQNPQAQQGAQQQPGAPEQVQHPQAQMQPKEQVHKVNTAQMKDHYFQVMQQAGIPVRQLDPENKQKLFTRGGSQDGTVQGTFYIPTYLADGRQLHDDEAFQLAKKVTDQFKGVQLKGWQEVKGGYRYDWHNKSERAQGITGTSFDELFGNSGGGGAGGGGGSGGAGPAPAKAASTLNELIKFNKQDLYDKMRRIANGA